ncbi:hypothetical protein CVT25_004762 [Psilocybe cyanescens]|uniref:Uncharacterized protein n=1 Tax=Psilocybe cyanescens TaxID=93625 RepID=A0A409XVU2_PSICY|nr:hypothetical protein CVT25_004762 [Psilocybe cyanescens]
MGRRQCGKPVISLLGQTAKEKIDRGETHKGLHSTSRRGVECTSNPQCSGTLHCREMMKGTFAAGSCEVPETKAIRNYGKYAGAIEDALLDRA